MTDLDIHPANYSGSEGDMGLGVLDAVHDEHVPGKTQCHQRWTLRMLTRCTGTSFVLDDASRPPQAGGINSRLKYDGSIILVPQPSDDPNDPLVRTQSYTSQAVKLLTRGRTGHYGSATPFSPSSPSSPSSHRR